MESHEITESFEKMLQREADAMHTPLTGTIELLPLCNMNCKMCYVHQTQEEMNAQGRMLTCDEWLCIVESACEKGLLRLLLTGGEPLLFPEFKRLYAGISKMGVNLFVNTNGTLIDEDWADFFFENGVRRLQITLYGKDDATYKKLCNNPKGFTQVIQAAELLKDREVPFRFNCSLTPDNIDQLPELYKIAKYFDVPLSPAAYMFPGTRRGKTIQEQYRLTAEEAAMAEIYDVQKVSVEEAQLALSRLDPPSRLKDRIGFLCHAGRSTFSINWKGELLPCLSFQQPSISLLEHPFGTCWDYLVNACEKLPQCQKCIECDMQNICYVCPAYCYSETGSTDGCPEYICQMTKCMVQELKKIAAAENMSI